MRLDGHFSGQERGDADRRGRLAGELRAAVEEAHPVRDLLLGDEDALDSALLADAYRVLACERRAQPVGQRARLDGDRLAGLEPAMQSIRELGLDRDHPAAFG